MSLLIKGVGMEMPQNCCECPLNMVLCNHGYKYLYYHPELYDKRADDCPSIEVPWHGDLIDRDAFEKSLSTLLQFPSNLVNGQWIVNAIREQPTIIDADNK